MYELGKPGRPLRLGIIGLGARGSTQLDLLLSMPDVVIAAVCDLYEDRTAEAASRVLEKSGHQPFTTLQHAQLLAREDIEAVLIMSGWQSHLSLAVEALQAGKIVGLEVGGAASLQECWRLVEESERSGLPVMLLENCCYGREEMAVLNMVRQGLFGDLVHCRGAYAHDLRDEIGEGDLRRHYRLENFLNRNGDLYPTHELGPIAKYLNLGRGNRMESLVSMASKSLGQSLWLQENRPESALARQTFHQGDIVTTMIRCSGGQTILLTHDCTLPRPYSRGGLVQGTRGIWQEDGRGIFIEGRTKTDAHSWAHHFESDALYMEEFMHPLWQAYEAFGKRGGHGGMDYLVLRAFIESIQQGQPFPIDVYDTASWMAITALSEQSIALGSQPVAIPDFSNGKWTLKRPVYQGSYALDDLN